MVIRIVEKSRKDATRVALRRQRIEGWTTNHTPPASALGHDACAQRARELTQSQFTPWG